MFTLLLSVSYSFSLFFVLLVCCICCFISVCAILLFFCLNWLDFRRCGTRSCLTLSATNIARSNFSLMLDEQPMRNEPACACDSAEYLSKCKNVASLLPTPSPTESLWCGMRRKFSHYFKANISTYILPWFQSLWNENHEISKSWATSTYHTYIILYRIHLSINISEFARIAEKKQMREKFNAKTKTMLAFLRTSK